MPRAEATSAIERGRLAVFAALGQDDRLYYLCQILGWGSYACLLFAIMASQGQALSGVALVAGAWTGTGLACTHIFRTYTKQHPWGAGPQLAVRLALATVLIAAAIVAAQTATSELYWLYAGRNDPRRSSILLHFIQAEMAAIVWCALYLSVHEVRRRQAVEVEALRLALVAQAAQFHTLRSQLNPHFLFNCLNNLRELIREEPERAERLVTELAELLRYTLQADRVETVPLKEEIHAVRQYLSLEKVRFEERLRLRFEIEPGALGVLVPPMLLQTLAENALKHGIANLPGGGEVAIHAYLKERQLEVVITNPGSLCSRVNATAVGLNNARERLRLIYGAAASLSLLDEPGRGVEARVTLPLDDWQEAR
jgi:two-component system sensor histidine kinase AlgZ